MSGKHSTIVFPALPDGGLRRYLLSINKSLFNSKNGKYRNEKK